MRLLTRVLVICLTVSVLAALADGTDDDDARAIQLAGVGGSGLREASVPLGGRLSRRSDGWLSASVETATYSLIGVTWRGTPTRAALRTHGTDGWSGWQRLDVLGPQEGDVRGTELLWAPDSDGFEVKVAGEREELTVELIDPGELATDSTPKAIPPGDDTDRAPRPRLFTRDDWGADESWRDGGPWYVHTIKQVHIHHTATGNNYARKDVPALIRGMYRYHTKSLGWSDLGYNFVVDRFGRTWVGRHGGYWRPVRGAHTLGFNHSSVGVALLGNYTKKAVSWRAVQALVNLAAYKLDPYDRRPRGWIQVTSHGSDLYREGKVVRLKVIDGHRDTNQTACPGDRLYDKLSRIRKWTEHRVDRFDPAPQKG